MKIRTNQRNILTSILASMVLFVFLVSPVHAFFGEQESSNENLFDASSLGIALAVTDVTEESRETEVTADHEEDIEYLVAKASSTGDFCADVELVIERDAVELYNGTLTSFTETATTSLPASDTDELSFVFSVADDGASYVGDCAITFSYQANQTGYAHGEAFFDSEDDMFVLMGSDFGTPAPLGVVLNEILPNPEGDDSQGGLQGEWIEIYNNGNAPVDLTGWYIKDAVDNQVLFESGSTLGGQMEIGIPGSTNEWVVLYMPGAILNNDGDTVYLYNHLDQLQDEYSYGPNTNENDADSDSNNTPGDDNESPSGSETEFNEGKSDARIPDGIGNWVDPEPTAGEPNYVSEEELEALGYSPAQIAFMLARQEAARQVREAQEEVLVTVEQVPAPAQTDVNTDDDAPAEGAPEDGKSEEENDADDGEGDGADDVNDVDVEDETEVEGGEGDGVENTETEESDEEGDAEQETASSEGGEHASTEGAEDVGGNITKGAEGQGDDGASDAIQPPKQTSDNNPVAE